MAAIPGFASRLLALWALLGIAGGAPAAEIAAPYVPTAPSVVERMLEIAKVGPDDFVIDLGSGDGRINITAAKKHGARGVGIEIDPKLVALAGANARAAGVADRVSFQQEDLFTADLSRASVITIYLLKIATMKLRVGLFDLKPGTRIVSHAASMGEWGPDHFEMLDVKDKVRPDAPKRTYIHYWIVPAKVAGTWRWSVPVAGQSRSYELDLAQNFQVVSGTLRAGGQEVKIGETKLSGDGIALEFSLSLDGKPLQHRLSGRAEGDSISGTMFLTGGPAREEVQWKAARVASRKAVIPATADAAKR